MSSAQQALLPYPELPKVAGRETFRSVAKRTSLECYQIPLSKLAIREGVEPFNARRKPPGMPYETYWETVLEIPALARSIVLDGLTDPIEGDLTQDGSIFYITEGHRRYLALLYISEEGLGERFMNKADEVQEILVTVKPNPNWWTELDRLKRPFTSQQRLELRPVEWAFHLAKIKKYQRKEDGTEFTNEELGEMFHKSRQWADNMIAVSEMDEETIAKIESGDLKITNALVAARKKKTDELKEMNESNPRNSSKNHSKGQSESLTSEDTPFDKEKGASKDELNAAEGEFKQNPTYDPFGRPEGHPDFGKPVEHAPGFTYDRTSIDEQEKDFNKPTNPNFKEARPKKDQGDALISVDFKAQKTEAEMDLNEAKKMVDKILVMCDSLPKGQKQFQEDVQRLCVFIVRKVENAQAIIKQAADER